MKKLVLYGTLLAALTVLLQLVEYRFLILDNAFEIYGGIIALLFTIIGVVAGRKLTERKKVEVIIEKEVPVQVLIAATDFTVNHALIEKLGISRREYEVLELMAEGLSNQEIAERTYVSIHTIKTHISNLFMKLDVKRRTQAVTKAREQQLIP